MTKIQKIEFVAGVVLAVGLFFLGRCNGIQHVIKHTGSDTAVNKKNTVITISYPVPYEVVKDSFIYFRHTVHDTLEVEGDKKIVYVPEDTPQWLVDAGNDYMATRLYDSTITDGNDTLRLQHEINRNRIKKSAYTWKHSDTLITKTTVLYPPRKLVLYGTLGSSYNLYNQFGIHFGMALKTPKEHIYQQEFGFQNGSKHLVFKTTVFFTLFKF